MQQQQKNQSVSGLRFGVGGGGIISIYRSNNEQQQRTPPPKKMITYAHDIYKFAI